MTGAYKALLSWCRSATEFEHIWILPKGSKVIPEVGQEFTVYAIPFLEIGRNPVKLCLYLPMLLLNSFRMRRIVKREKPALLHGNDLYNLLIYGAQLFLQNKRPVVVHARMLKQSFPAFIYECWKRVHLKYATRIIAVSEAIKRDWCNDDRVTVIYDPIAIREDLPHYAFHPKIDEPFRFLYLANYINGKGQDDALAAIKLLSDQGVHNFIVHFYGSTMGLEKNEAYKTNLLDYVAEHKLEALVAIHDPVTEVEKVMKSYDALLHLSHAESFGMVCYEALYYGLPVISSDCGGPREMMEPELSGLLIPLKDVDGYARAMRRMLEDHNLGKRLSVNASSFIRSKFSEGNEINQLIFNTINHS